jgi:hypothetical protein
MHDRLVLCTVCLLAAGVTSVDAQPARPAGRARVSVNAGYQATANDFRQSLTFQEFLEDGTIDTDYVVAAAPSFDAGLMVRIWRALGVGGAFSYFTAKDPAPVSASIPHPFFFNRHRQVSGSTGDLARTETAFHLQAAFFVPLGLSLDAVVFGGVSFFDIEQDFVVDVNYTHSFPFDTATFQQATARAISESAVGFNAGVDIGWWFSRHVGVGGQLRFARATATFTSTEGNAVDVDAGGFNAGAGIRVIF